MSEYIGKICPYCKTEIKEGDAVTVCSNCGIPHHEGCWTENNGCTTFGCSQQVAAPAASLTAVCSNCGTPLADGDAFCPKCGAAKPATAPAPSACRNCGAPLQPDQAFCAKCGQKVDMQMDQNISAAINQFNANVAKKTKKSPKLPIILGAVAAVVIIALILLFKGPSVEEITLSEIYVELREGDSVSVSYTITPADARDATVTWRSSDESVATVNSSGQIYGFGDGTCTITATAGGKSDSLTVTVKSGPDFRALYDAYCKATWADCGTDDSYLSIDTNPYDWDDDGLAFPDAYTAVKNIVSSLNLPDSLLNDISETNSLDGRRTESYDTVTVSWTYHPDQGLEITFKAN